jgi:hypothetical protein
MGVLKRKEERSETVTVRVPGSMKAELDRLREETAAAGFDPNATLSEAVIRDEAGARRAASSGRQGQWREAVGPDERFGCGSGRRREGGLGVSRR